MVIRRRPAQSVNDRTELVRSAADPGPVSSDSTPATPETLTAALAMLRAGTVTLDPYALPPVVAARTLIADTVAQIPLVATKGNRVARSQPAILRRPDPTEPRWTTFARIVNDLTGPGRAWLLITARDAADRANAIRVIPAREVTAELDEFGRPDQIVWNPPSAGSRRYRVGRDVIHVPNLLDVDNVGRGPIDACREVMDGVAALYQSHAQFWTESGVPPFAILSRYGLDSEQTADLQAQWVAARSRSGLPAVLTGDLELRELAGTSGALYADALEQAIATTGRVFRIPPALLNARSGDSLTYSTTESQFTAWRVTGLTTYLSRLEAAFSDLLPHGTDARADLGELLRADTGTRFTAYESAIRAGWLTVDEVRGMEGRDPLGGVTAANPNDPNAPASTAGTGTPATAPTLTGA